MSEQTEATAQLAAVSCHQLGDTAVALACSFCTLALYGKDT